MNWVRALKALHVLTDERRKCLDLKIGRSSNPQCLLMQLFRRLDHTKSQGLTPEETKVLRQILIVIVVALGLFGTFTFGVRSKIDAVLLEKRELVDLSMDIALANSLETELRALIGVAERFTRADENVTRQDLTDHVDLLETSVAAANVRLGNAGDDDFQAEIHALSAELPTLKNAVDDLRARDISKFKALLLLTIPHVESIHLRSEEMGTALSHAGMSMIEEHRSQSALLRSAEQQLLGGTAIGFLILIAEIVRSYRLVHRLNRANAKNKTLARSDHLTGLSNRRSLEMYLEDAIRDCRTRGEGICLLIVDLDNFKLLNDSLGHEFGDRLLKAVGSELGKMQGVEAVGRMGGDEFAIIMAGGVQEGLSLADSVREAVQRAGLLFDSRFNVSCSIGIAFAACGDTEAARHLFRNADLAMYDAKRTGRNRSVVFYQQLACELALRAAVEASLAEALSAGELELYLQPILDLNTGRPRAFEALTRWTHADVGPIRPDLIFQVADTLGMSRTLGNWVLDEACALSRDLKAIGCELPISVNVNLHHAACDEFVDDVLDAVERYDLSRSAIALEFTEEDLVSQVDAVVQRMRTLHEMGFQIAIDDFGKGYSNFGRLLLFPFTVLKLDKSIITNFHSDPHVLKLLTAFAQFSKSLGMRLVVEGVEDETMLPVLRNAGVGYVQGYCYARPMDRNKLNIWLMTQIAKYGRLSNQPVSLPLPAKHERAS